MTRVTDRSEMCELRLLKRNAYKAMDDVLQKRKRDETMEGLRNEVEPLIHSFVQSVSKHFEVLENEEGDNDDEIESWEMHAELVRIK